MDDKLSPLIRVRDMAAQRFTPRLRGQLWSLAGNGAVICCSVAAFWAVFLSLYGDMDTLLAASVNPTPLAEFCAAESGIPLLGFAVLMGLAGLAVWSLPRFRALAAAAVTALWAGLCWLFRERLIRGALLVLQSIGGLFLDRVDWIPPIDLELDIIKDLTAPEQLDAIRVFSMLYLAMVALLLGWAVARARSWGAAVPICLVPLLPALLSDVYPAWAPFLLLCACWCAMLLADLCRRTVPSGWGKLLLAALGASWAALALLFLLLPVQGYQRPVWAVRAEDRLVDFVDRHLEFLREIEGPFGDGGDGGSGTAYVGSPEEADLTKAGPLRFSGRTVLKVTAGWSGRTLLRGASLGRYEDGVWKALPKGTYNDYTESVGLYEGAGDISPLVFPAFSSGGTPRTVTVENTGASGSCVYAPYYLADQDFTAAGLLPLEDCCLAHRRGTWSYTFDVLPGEPGPAQLSDAAGYALSVYEDFVLENYMDVPGELARLFSSDDEDMAALRGTALRPAGAALPANGQRIALASRTAQALARLCEYDTDTTAAPAGEDPVAWFLTESHRGYCMHFAAAATLLLRWSGVPARYVSGYSAELEAGGTANVPDSAAHAWVEIWLDGCGWYPVDVTPDVYHTGTQEGAAPVNSPAPSDGPAASPALPAVPSRTPEAAPVPSAPADTGEQPAGTGSGGAVAAILAALAAVLRWLAVLAAAAALLWLGQAVPKLLRRARLNGPDTNQAVLAGYRYLKRMAKWGGQLPAQAAVLAQKAWFSQQISEIERAGMAALVDGQRTVLRGSLRGPKKLLFHYWWGFPPKEGSSDDLA